MKNMATQFNFEQKSSKELQPEVEISLVRVKISI